MTRAGKRGSGCCKKLQIRLQNPQHLANVHNHVAISADPQLTLFPSLLFSKENYTDDYTCLHLLKVPWHCSTTFKHNHVQLTAREKVKREKEAQFQRDARLHFMLTKHKINTLCNDFCACTRSAPLLLVIYLSAGMHAISDQTSLL
jgi:hypothetical protein